MVTMKNYIRKQVPLKAIQYTHEMRYSFVKQCKESDVINLRLIGIPFGFVKYDAPKDRLTLQTAQGERIVYITDYICFDGNNWFPSKQRTFEAMYQLNE